MTKLTKFWFSVIFLALSGVSRAQLTDDFIDGDFTSNPAWVGTGADFIINPSLQLQLNNTIAATSWLSTPNNLATLNDVEWQFWIRLNFSPSTSNYGRVYLVSDQTDVSGPLNGYFLQFGEAGATDAIELFRQDGTTLTSVARGSDGLVANSFILRVRVRRDNVGNWEIGVSPAGGNTFNVEATGTDATYNATQHLGLLCVYTVSNADRYYFDDFYVGPWVFDVTPPSLSTVTVISDTELDVLLNEALDITTAQTVSNYSVNNGIGAPATALLDGVNPALVHLTFGTSFTNGTTYQLGVQNVEDLAGNPMTLQQLPFTYLVFGTPSYRDVVINEIFPIPTPQLGLPAAEFVEIYNTSNQYFQLNGWKLCDATGCATLKPWVLGPGEYLVLCANADTVQFFFLPNKMGLASWPTLNNSGDDMKLEDNNANLLDFVPYKQAWFNDAVKQNGGWTLELKRPHLPCLDVGNWSAAVDPNGGTPGFQNSIYDPTPDTDAPVLTGAVSVTSAFIELLFNESQDSASVSNALVTVSGGVNVVSITPVGPMFDKANLIVTPPVSAGIYYDIAISGNADCSGNSTGSTARFILPEVADSGDLIINEVLFNPQTGGSDFVEVYNRSQKVVSLKGYLLANISSGSMDNFRQIISNDYLFKPGEYVVITRDTNYVKSEYPFAASGVFIQMSNTMPSYNNDSSTVFILKPDSSVMDKFSYTDKMHFPLLREEKGVTLERISPERPASDGTNWHSAAESQNFGTPGYLNSQFTDFGGNDVVTVSPETFSPDNDGIDDVLTISYVMDQPGAVATIRIFDAMGRLVRTLVQNELLGTEGAYSWDGITDWNEKARIGIHIVHFEYFYTDGKVSSKKLSCVVAHRF